LCLSISTTVKTRAPTQNGNVAHAGGSPLSDCACAFSCVCARARARVCVCVCVRVAHVKPRHGLVCNIMLPPRTACTPLAFLDCRATHTPPVPAALIHSPPTLPIGFLPPFTASCLRPPPYPFNEGQFISPYYFFSLFHPILFFTLFRHPSTPPV